MQITRYQLSIAFSNQIPIQHLFIGFVFCFILQPLMGQNDVKARLEFANAEELFDQGNYEESLKKIELTESFLGSWTPRVSFLKILALRKLAILEDIENPQTLELLKECSKYIDFYGENPDGIILDKYKMVYEIDNELLFIKKIKPLKDTQEFKEGEKAFIEKAYEEAIKWFKLGIEKGNAACMNYMGLMYFNGLGVEKDLEEAVKMYGAAASKDYPPALANLGLSYLNGMGVEQDTQKAMGWFSKANNFGFPLSMYYTGVMYEFGQRVNIDLKLAKEWYEKAVAKGHTLSALSLGEMYRTGRGVPVDYEKAFELLYFSAERGNAIAMNTLGVMFYNGNGVEINYKIANEWYLKAANKGNSAALFNVGLQYQYGRGFEKDFVKASEWFEKAVASGYNNSLKQLSQIYETGGFGLKRDKKRSEEYLARFNSSQ
jgi:uncharacterized protein